MPDNITAGYRATGVYPINPSLVPDATFAPILLTHSDDAQVCNVVTVTDMPHTALLLQQKSRKASPVRGTSGNVVLTNRFDKTLAYGTEQCR